MLNLSHSTKRLHLKEKTMMKSLYEELGGTYTLGDDGMLYPDLLIGDKDPRPIGKMGRMHMKYLEVEHPGLYERLILNGNLYRHLADANERATSMLERLVEQISAQEGVIESMKEVQPLEWISKMNSIRSRAEETILHDVILPYKHNTPARPSGLCRQNCVSVFQRKFSVVLATQNCTTYSIKFILNIQYMV